MWRNWNPCALLVKCKMVQLLWKKHGWFLKKLNIDLPYDPEILLLGIHPKEMKAETRTDMCTLIFMAVLFTTAKRWKQPKCPLMDE